MPLYRGPADPRSRGFTISGYDLIGSGDFDLSTERSGEIGGANPHAPDAEAVVIFLESSDDNQFSVTVEWKDEDDNTRGTVDNNIAADLQSASPTGGNHYVYVDVALAFELFNIVITDDSGGGQNNIDGTIYAT